MTAPSPAQVEAERLCNAGMFFAKWAAQKVQADVAAALQALTLERDRLREFARWCMSEGPWEGSSLDGGDIQDKAAELGVVVCVPYDPAVHGPNDCDASTGDDWYVMAWSLNQPVPASTGEQKDQAE